MSGVTTMRIDAGLDTGDILLQKEIPIAPEDTAVTLAPRMAAIGADLMVETLHGLAGRHGRRPIRTTPSDACAHSEKRRWQDRFPSHAQGNPNRLRGFQPWPGAFTTFRGKNLFIRSARAMDTGADSLARSPRTLAVYMGNLFVSCGSSTLMEILELQLEGKKRMPATAFIHGYQPKPDECLGE